MSQVDSKCSEAIENKHNRKVGSKVDAMIQEAENRPGRKRLREAVGENDKTVTRRIIASTLFESVTQ